jgi:hypothetical protein
LLNNTEFEMLVKDYGMFSTAGNKRVATIVKRARAKRWTWSETYKALIALGNKDKYGEATDTDVREQVYSAIGAEQRNESFWA